MILSQAWTTSATLALSMAVAMFVPAGAQQPEGCSLPVETGSCLEAVQRYFFDTKSQECKRFTYSGCQGNANNFHTLAQCLDTCKKTSKDDGSNGKISGRTSGWNQPSQTRGPNIKTEESQETIRYTLCSYSIFVEIINKVRAMIGLKLLHVRSYCKSSVSNVCYLPPDPGNCRAYKKMFYYDSKSGSCKIFHYGGCSGNGNRFKTADECEHSCRESPRASQNVCHLLPEIGPCDALIPKLFYNASSGLCEKFNYGGCLGNENRFDTEQECQKRCRRETPQPETENICSLSPEHGPCEAIIPRYFYNANSGICEQFIYGGCEGNDNRFETLAECDKRCRTTQSPNICLLPPETGPCRALITSFYYNSTSGKCELFTYGGCGGNENRFETEAQCQERCHSESSDSSRDDQDVCSLPADSGLCLAYIPKYHFNITSRKCEEFTYGGCGGNDNRFDSKDDCESRCPSKKLPLSRDHCLLQPNPGPCDAIHYRYFYNSTSETCEQFIYGGCGGNDNRFETKPECQDNCDGTISPTPKEICKLPADSGPCQAYIPQFFYNTSSRACEQFIYGGCRGNENRFETQTDCQKKCVSKEDICLLLPETGPCKAHIPSYFYNATSDVCEQFIYGGCDGNENRFGTKTDCDRKCGIPPSADRCLLPPETGPCRASIPRFYYNATSDKCENFTYGGCQGNDNRFETENECYDNCGGVTSKTRQEICQLPADSGPCQAYIPQFFYNTSSRACEQFIYGGCRGNENRFETEAQCQDRCQNVTSPSSRDLQDVCSLPADGGPCRAYIPKYHFNITSRKCEEFIYGGCDGNDNSFDSKADCESKCPSTALPVSRDRCLLHPDAGPCYGSFSRYFYNSTTESCQKFIYGGCGGNLNKFDTEADCRATCSIP